MPAAAAQAHRHCTPVILSLPHAFLHQVLQNRNKYGWNRLTPPPTTPWYIKYLMQYANIFMLLLMFGGELQLLLTT